MPENTTLPSRSASTRSACSASSSMCVATTAPAPPSRARTMRLPERARLRRVERCRRLVEEESRGAPRKAIARLSRCWLPTERCADGRPSGGSSNSASSSSAERVRIGEAVKPGEQGQVLARPRGGGTAPAAAAPSRSPSAGGRSRPRPRSRAARPRARRGASTCRRRSGRAGRRPRRCGRRGRSARARCARRSGA